MEIKKVGIVGCGIMGSGISVVCAQSGYQVVVSEISGEVLKKGVVAIDSIMTKSVEKGKISQQDKESALSRIKGTTDANDFRDCDFMIEAAVENMEVKKKLFANIDKICPKHTILATNTSSLPIIQMAVITRRKDKVLGFHFSNPAYVMKILEVIRTIATSDETLTIAKDFGKSLGKTVVVAKDVAGFIGSRLLTPYLLQAIRMLENGDATKEDIDTMQTLGLNHPMGPFALADFAGLDTLLATANIMYEEYKEPMYAPPPLLKRMVDAGWLGRKTGKGFYEYK